MGSIKRVIDIKYIKNDSVFIFVALVTLAIIVITVILVGKELNKRGV